MDTFQLIGGASQEADVSPDTVRRWEREGLIKPLRLGNRRMYSPADIRRLKEIREQKARGRRGPRG